MGPLSSEKIGRVRAEQGLGATRFGRATEHSLSSTTTLPKRGNSEPDERMQKRHESSATKGGSGHRSRRWPIGSVAACVRPGVPCPSLVTADADGIG